MIITRRGKPCGRLTTMSPGEQKPSLRTLRGAYADVLPDATYQDFLDIKSTGAPPAARRRGSTTVLDSPARFVVDTHALWWYLTTPERLSAAVSAVFRLVETGRPTLIVPAIVVAELYYLSVKLRATDRAVHLWMRWPRSAGIELSDLGRTPARAARFGSGDPRDARPPHRRRGDGARRAAGDA